MLVVGVRSGLFWSEAFEVLILNLFDTFDCVVAISIKCTLADTCVSEASSEMILVDLHRSCCNRPLGEILIS